MSLDHLLGRRCAEWNHCPVGSAEGEGDHGRMGGIAAANV